MARGVKKKKKEIFLDIDILHIKGKERVCGY